MTRLTIHKIVGAVPPTGEPNALYLMRTGAGFNIMMSNSDGTAVHPLNTLNVDVVDKNGPIAGSIRYWVGEADAVDGPWSIDYTSAGFTRVLSVIPVCTVPEDTWIPTDGKYVTLFDDTITNTGCNGSVYTSETAVNGSVTSNKFGSAKVRVTVMGIV